MSESKNTTNIPSLVAERAYWMAYAPLRSAQHALDILARPASSRGAHRTLAKEESKRIQAALDALSPKEAELVKPPREYEDSGDAVGGGLAEQLTRFAIEEQRSIASTLDRVREQIGKDDTEAWNALVGAAADLRIDARLKETGARIPAASYDAASERMREADHA